MCPFPGGELGSTGALPGIAGEEGLGGGDCSPPL